MSNQARDAGGLRFRPRSASASRVRGATSSAARSSQAASAPSSAARGLGEVSLARASRRATTAVGSASSASHCAAASRCFAPPVRARAARSPARGESAPRQGPVDRGGTDGDLHQGRQDLLGDGGHVLQGLQRLGGQAGVPEALDDQVGVGQRPRPDAVRVVVVPQPVVEPGRPVAFGQVGRPEDLFDRPRIEALDGGVVQQPREVGSSRAGLDPGPVQQVQTGAVLDDRADVMVLETGGNLPLRAVGDGDEPVDVGVGDLLQPAALPVMGVGVVLGAPADPGVDPLSQLRLGGGGRGRVQQGGEGRRFDGRARFRPGRARIRPGPCLRLLVRPRSVDGAPTRTRPANRPVIRPGDGAAIRGPVDPTMRSRWCRVEGIGLGHGAPSVGGEGGSTGWDRGAGTLPRSGSRPSVATGRRSRPGHSAGGRMGPDRGHGVSASVRVYPRPVPAAPQVGSGAPSSEGVSRRAAGRSRGARVPRRARGRVAEPGGASERYRAPAERGGSAGARGRAAATGRDPAGTTTGPRDSPVSLFIVRVLTLGKGGWRLSFTRRPTPLPS